MDLPTNYGDALARETARQLNATLGGVDTVQSGTLAIASGTGSVTTGIVLTSSSRIIVTLKGRPTGSTNFAGHAVTARTAGADGVAAFTVEFLVAAGTIDSDAAGDVDYLILN